SSGFSGLTRTSLDRPMVFIARAAAPMLPGCWVPTRTMRMAPAAPAADCGAMGDSDMAQMVNCAADLACRNALLIRPTPTAFTGSLRHAQTRRQRHGQGRAPGR